jgi:hypothetical protein
MIYRNELSKDKLVKRQILKGRKVNMEKMNQMLLPPLSPEEISEWGAKSSLWPSQVDFPRGLRHSPAQTLLV